MTNRAYLLLGGDKGDRISNINKAIDRIKALSETPPLISHLYESDPWGFDSDNKFLNVAVIISTNLDAHSLLHILLEIERDLGRVRNFSERRYESREIDIDIIFFNNEIIEDEELTIPHPRMHLRRFVLEPLNSIASQFIHPTLNEKVEILLERCEDNSEVTQVTGERR